MSIIKIKRSKKAMFLPKNNYEINYLKPSEIAKICLECDKPVCKGVCEKIKNELKKMKNKNDELY